MASLALDAAPSDGGFTLHPNANAAYAAKSVVGGRCVDAAGVNSGMLRCPVCFSRLVSQRGVLTERSGEEASLWNPSREEVEAGTEAEAEAAVAGGGRRRRAAMAREMAMVMGRRLWSRRTGRPTRPTGRRG